MVKVSAIVSAYFAEDYLAGRLDNLFAQSLVPEVIVICQAGSKEREIVKGYHKVKVIATDDIPTIYAAWNVGVQAANGEYLTNANCDDRLWPDALKNMAAILDRKEKYSVVYGNQEIVNEIGGEPVGQFDWAEGDIEELLKGCFLGPMPMWRRSLHARYGMFDAEMHVAGDYEFWLRLAKAGEKFYHLKEITGQYYSSIGSAEKRQKIRTVWETARARARYRAGVGIWKY